MADVLWWVYGVTAAPGPTDLLEGVELLEHAGLAALVTPVPADEYSGAALERRLNDMETLERMARAHEAVLDHVLGSGEVVPLRMCTLYVTRDAVREMLASQRERLVEALERIEGAVELGVKGFASPPRPAENARPGSGAEYLAQRLARRDAAADAEASVERAAAELHARLADHADGAVLLRPQDRRLSGREARMVLNGAYLVRREKATAFAAKVVSEGLELEVTGPWPPYHFAEVRA